MKQRKIPERMCVACREMKPKTELIRLVLDEATQTATVDTTGKMSGRGVYLCKSKECLVKAKKNKGFAKLHGFAFTDELYTQLEKLIEG